MMFTSDKVVVDFQEWAYTLIGAGLGVTVIISLIAMILFVLAQLK